ncbi:MAG: tRNA dihydrouridine synthase DusB [Bacteroidetes bacterium]|nr:tRNA dihydrouridine synthase DusB [Bacteroidota bacterium]
MLKIGNILIPNFPLLLAPMEDITDPPFRALCKRFGADIMITEFISSEGLIRDVSKSIQKLDFDETERPVGIQIFGHNMDAMCRATEVAEEANPDFIDINWGCPVKKVASKGAGSGILNDIPKMIQITEAIVKSTKLPVTVKTRLGWDEHSKPIVEIAERLQDIGIQAISIHGRTKAQLYHGEADWTLIGKVKNNPRMKIPVFGNGDIDSPQKAKEMLKYGTDGLMIGRACIGNPWIFRDVKYFFETGNLPSLPNIAEKVNICKEHIIKSIEWKGEKTGLAEMRKHYSGYFKNIPDFKPYRIRLVTSTALEDIFETLEEVSNL